jgi:LPS O-antigen subunit length determinant protein (WzzB/FepE family)
MPIEKRDPVEDRDTLNLTKVMWMIVFAVIAIVLMAFVSGVLVHYVVEFFGKGWDLVG